MTVTHAAFVARFPAFKDGQKFPCSLVDLLIAEAPNSVNERIMRKNYDRAVMLYVAHNLVIEAQNTRAAATGIPGTPVSPVQSKTVGEVSITYDTKGTEIEGAGAWNATIYGQQLYTLMKAVGTGPYYRVPPRRSPGF